MFILAVLMLHVLVATDGHRILGIFSHIGGSHFHTFYPIMNGLANKGHDVTVLSYFKSKNASINYKELIFEGLPIINSSISLDVMKPSRSMYSLYYEFYELYSLGDLTCRDTLFSDRIDYVLSEHARHPYDLVITELFDSDCMLGVIHKMQVPYVGLSSCALMPWLYDRISLPDIPSYIPSEFVGFSDTMSFTERMVSWISMKSLKLLYRLVERNDNRLLKEKFGDGVPDVAELAKKISLLLVNQHFSLSGPRPLSSQLIEIGGVHIKDSKPLPPNLQNLVDNAKHGVILISWGSNIKASTLQEEKFRSIIRALSKFPHQIVWKWENTTFPKNAPNVHIQQWLPQKDILCHPNVKLFWSHGGNLGVLEAVNCGVPVITTPIYGDQFLNAAALVKRGMGLTLPYSDINEQNVFEAISNGLQPSYANNAKLTSFSFCDRPMTPLNTALWWIEHVLATGGFPFAKSFATELSWFVYHSIDVMFVLFIGITFVVVAIRCTVCRCWRHRRQHQSEAAAATDATAAAQKHKQS